MLIVLCNPFDPTRLLQFRIKLIRPFLFDSILKFTMLCNLQFRIVLFLKSTISSDPLPLYNWQSVMKRFLCKWQSVSLSFLSVGIDLFPLKKVRNLANPFWFDLVRFYPFPIQTWHSVPFRFILFTFWSVCFRYNSFLLESWQSVPARYCTNDCQFWSVSFPFDTVRSDVSSSQSKGCYTIRCSSDTISFSHLTRFLFILIRSICPCFAREDRLK